MQGKWTTLAVGLGLLVAVGSARGQVLQGPWVNRTNKRIDQCRKTSVRVIVLDAGGNVVPHAAVSIQQTRRAFALGFVLPGDHWPKVNMHQPVWRCFSAVTLAPLTDWPDLEPRAGKAAAGGNLRRVIQQAQARGMQIRWGPMVSTDIGQEPDWAAKRQGNAFRRVVESYMRWALTHFGRRVSQFDLFADTLDNPLAGRGFDLRSLRTMLERLKTVTPATTFCSHFRDALLGPRLQSAFSRMVRMQQAFVPIDAISLSQVFHDRVLHLRLRSALHQWDQLHLPLIVRIEVGGQNSAQATVNLETVLRTLFSDPQVAGITLAALRPSQASDPAAALLDKQGKPSASGKLFDRLFHQHWRTHLHVHTDRLGNVHCRVFAGAYHITAQISAHTKAAADVWLGRQKGTQLVVVQPGATTQATQPTGTQPSVEGH